MSRFRSPSGVIVNVSDDKAATLPGYEPVGGEAAEAGGDDEAQVERPRRGRPPKQRDEST